MLRNRRGESQEAESSSSANRSISQKLQQQRAQDSDDSEDEVEDELLGRERRSIQSAFLRALSPPLPSGIDGSKRWNSLKQDAEKVEKGKGKGKEKEKNEEKERPIPENELQEQDHDGADLMCRICWCGDLEEDEGPEGQLIAPCGCSGTSKVRKRDRLPKEQGRKMYWYIADLILLRLALTFPSSSMSQSIFTSHALKNGDRKEVGSIPGSVLNVILDTR